MNTTIKIYLYDPRYNLKTETSYEKIEGIFRMKECTARSYKSKKQKINKKYYIIDENTSLKEIKELYAREDIKDEAWKEIEGSGGEFLVSNYGRFKRKYKHKERFIMPYYITRKVNVNKNKAFLKVKFNGAYKEYSAARIVAHHFVDIFHDEKHIKYRNAKEEDLVVFHKNGLVHDNYHGNLEYLDRGDLGKRTGYKQKGIKSIVAIDADTGKIIDWYRSTRHAAKELYISKQTVCDHLNGMRKSPAGGKYIFKYE